MQPWLAALVTVLVVAGEGLFLGYATEAILRIVHDFRGEEGLE